MQSLKTAVVFLFAATALPCLTTAFAQAESIAVFQAEELLGRNWHRTLVTYDVEFERGKAAGNEFHLTDDAGERYACQLSRVERHDDGSIKSAHVSFFAELPEGGSYLYQLLPGASPNVENSPAVSRQDGFLVIDNNVTALRLLDTGRQTFDESIAFSTDPEEMVKSYGRQLENGIIPGPLQGVRLNSGEWIGGSYFWTRNLANSPKATSYECSIVERGPLFVEAKIRYTFDNDGWYQFTARLLADDPAARIDEQLDMGMGNGWNQRIVTSFSRGWEEGGWKPDSLYWNSSEGRVRGHDVQLEQQLEQIGLPVEPYNNVNFGSQRFTYDKPYQNLFNIEPWYPWKNAWYFGAIDSADLPAPEEGEDAEQSEMTELERELLRKKACESIRFVSVVPMHTGNWRGNHKVDMTMLGARGSGDFTVSWALIADPHPRSLLHTGEYDPELPFSFVRRQWALIAGPMQYHDQLRLFRRTEGFVNLDNYKEWVLAWEMDDEITYPRLVFGKEDIERLAPTLDDHPGAGILKEHLYFNDNPERAARLYKNLTADSSWSGPRGQLSEALGKWVAHYRHTQMASWAGNMDELLSSEQITLEQRKQLRAYLAGICNILSEPDFNPRGAMVHLGNPNMPMNRFYALPIIASLIPDHPRAQEWLDVSDRYLRYKLAMNVAPGGTWSELVTYFAASAPHNMQAAAVLERTGRLSDKTAELAALPAKFTLQLMSPVDPRFGTRTVPNWGHEGSTIGTHWMVAASLMRDRNPEFATELVWAWDQQGRPMDNHHDAGFSPRIIIHADLLSKLKPDYVPEDLKSTWLPGFGAVMRAHVGHPGETFLAYRQGYMISHCDPNQGDFVLYSKGAPLVVMCLSGYPIAQNSQYGDLYNEFGWHSNVRCGSRSGHMGHWNGTSHVHSFGFGDTVDYIRGAKQQGDQNWTRQIIFMKAAEPGGPDYFVFRDSFTKPEPTWWTLRTYGGPDHVQPGTAGFVYNSEFGKKLDVHFLQPQTMQLESRQGTRTSPLYHQGAINWRNAGSPIAKDNHLNNVSVEEVLTINSAGPAPAGTDIIAALAPLGTDETTPPKYERLADGVVKVETSDGMDYVFLRSQPISFSRDGVAFDGLAGAIRLRGNRVHLVVSEGTAKVSYRNLTLESEIPAQREFGANETQTVKIPAPPQIGIYDIQDDGTRITGRITGVSGGFHTITAPPWLDRLAELVIDGQTYAPGTSGNQFIIPIMPGEHEFELRALPQPPIWRNPREW